MLDWLSIGLGRSLPLEAVVVSASSNKAGSPRAVVRSSATLEATKPTRSTTRRRPLERQYVAIDLHLRRSLIVRENEAGEELGVVRIDNDPVA